MASTSSGFIIEGAARCHCDTWALALTDPRLAGRRVLTNAHSVDYATQVKLKHRGSETKYVARILSVGTECDLALLTVDDDSFWAGVAPIVMGRLPRLQDQCTVVGFPIGGDSLSVTAGVASRVEMTPYAHSSSELLAVQIDAAINRGNSGGPVFDSKGLCVGVAFQSLKHDDAENIGYVIPVPVIEHFLADYDRHKRYTGFPTLGLEWQKVESVHLRRALGLPAGEKGVLLRHVEPTSDAAKHVEKGDVLLSFDGHQVASDGTVPFRVGERIGFSHLVSNKFAGDTAELRVWHAGAAKTVRVQLGVAKKLIPVHTAGKPPAYYIAGGLVFTPASVPYLRSEYGTHFDYDSPVRLLEKMLHGHVKEPDEELVVLSQVLAADINIGYEDVVNTAVDKFNGVKVRNLRHLVQLVEACQDEYLRFELDYNTVLVLTAAAARAATPAILETHSIPQRASADLEDALRDVSAAAAGRKSAAAAAAAGRKPAAAAGAKRKGAEPSAAEGSPVQQEQEAAPPPPRRRR